VSDEPETARIVRSWLEDGVTVLPDRVLDAVLDQLPATPQRRPLWTTRRVLEMNTAVKRALGSAAVVVACLVGFGVLRGSPASGVAGTSPSPAPSPKASPSASPSAVPVPNGPMKAGSYFIDLPTYRLDFPGSVLAPLSSRHWLPDAIVRVSFQVPDGWSGIGWAITKDGAGPTQHLSMAPWTIGTIYLDPCHWRSSDVADQRSTWSRDGLAEDLTSYGSYDSSKNAPTSTGPTYTRLAGMDAKLVELTAPSDVDFATCDDGRYTLWADDAGGYRYLQGAGQIDRVWLLDVDGTGSQYQSGLVAIDAAAQSGDSVADRAELQSIVDSITISPELEPGATSSPGG
jgi:hypothetical protein